VPAASPNDDWFADTDPAVLAEYIRLHREMPMHMKIERIFELERIGTGMVRDRIRPQHPMADQREIFLGVASTRLDRESMIAVYTWDPELHP